MGSLIEVLITFVGVMLILALAAQSIQEVIKIVFAIKSQAAVGALRGLIQEAAKGTDLGIDGEAIFTSVMERLRGLGQDGVREGKVRLDTLTPDTLASLIASATPVKKSSLETTTDAKSEDRLKDVAAKAKEWFPLAWDPIDSRYGRRMRGYAILSAAIVVIGLNVDAFAVLRRAREDPAYRAAVTASAVRLESLAERVRRLSDSTPNAHTDTAVKARPDSVRATTDSASRPRAETTTTAHKPRTDSLKAAKDSLNTMLARIGTGKAGFAIGEPGAYRWRSAQWWIGIALSILLVSLGAPFWHDLLESLFGLKNRIRAEAKEAESKGKTP